MSAASYGNFISERNTEVLGYWMIGLGTCFVLMRFTIRAIKRRFWILEDVTVALAWACLVALCVGYIKVTPAVFRIAAVGRGQRAQYPTEKKDIEFLLKVFFPGTLLLWCCLWLVKFALLLNCRRLVHRQPAYMVIWWCIVGYAIVTFIGCVASELTSCRSMHDWFTVGQCSTPRDARASAISLFYAFAVDITSDLMIMIFPLRVLWNIQMSPLRKCSIMAVFAVSVIGISTSIVRVVQIRRKSGSLQPSPSWLEVWAMVESSIAVVVACLPTFGLLLPQGKQSRPGYEGSGPKPKPNQAQDRDIVLTRKSSERVLHGLDIQDDTSPICLRTVSQDGALGGKATESLFDIDPPTSSGKAAAQRSFDEEKQIGLAL